MADPRVTETIRAVARRRRVPFKHLKAAIETGIVESGLRNLPGGTGDSAGWRQERRSLYRDPTSVTHAAERFFSEAAAMDRPGLSSGELAARVQRPAAQYRGRYAQVASQAEQVLHGLSGVPYSPAAASTGSRVVNTLRESSQLDQGAFDSARKLAVVGRLLAKRHGTQGALFQSGVLSTEDPNPADFMRSTLTGGVSTRAAGGSAAAALPGGSGRTPTARAGKIIGTPYKGTHTLGNWQSDNAVDIAVPKGTPMVALQDGVIVKVRHHPQGAGRFAGDQITIRGANGNEYFYAHGVAHVRAGQKVRKGQKLGVTGSANGVEHLHFGQRRGSPLMHVGGR